MPRKRHFTRRNPKSNPSGILKMTQRGYGFVKTAEGEFFIAPHKTGWAMHGDMVEVACSKGHASLPEGIRSVGEQGRCPSGRVVRVLSRGTESLVGRYEIAEPYGVVVPLDCRYTHDIFTLRTDAPDIPDGALVRVVISNYPQRGSAATGVVSEMIAPDDTCGLIEAIIDKYKFETHFSKEEIAAADGCLLDIEGALRDGYRDVRDRFTLTIDPRDARDFDDALSVVTEENGWRVGIHIADVTRYVPLDSVLHACAQRRATSVYLVDRVLPMLPLSLSNELCSLKPNEDRLTLSVDFLLDTRFQVCSFEIYPAIICSNLRLTYEEVQEYLEAAGDFSHFRTSSCKEKSDLDTALTVLDTFASYRCALRKRSGAVEFSRPEAHVSLSEAGEPVDVVLKSRTRATSLVEECMIAANEVVAEYLHEAYDLGMYRCHEAPLPMRLESAARLFTSFSWFSKINRDAFIRGESGQLAQVLQEVSGRLEERVINDVLLRCMQRARYEVHCDGHYALGLEFYTHFTSPIRRYPDLVVHHLLKAALGVKISDIAEVVPVSFFRTLAACAEHASLCARDAALASLESHEVKLIEYMERFIGQTLNAMITRVTSYGISVMFENTAEGFISCACLGAEYYSYDADTGTLIGEDSGCAFRLGQRVEVVITEINPRLRELTLRLA